MVVPQKYKKFSFLLLGLSYYASWNERNFKKKRNNEKRVRLCSLFYQVGPSPQVVSGEDTKTFAGFAAEQITLACTEFLLFQNIVNSVPNIIYEY